MPSLCSCSQKHEGHRELLSQQDPPPSILLVPGALPPPLSPQARKAGGRWNACFLTLLGLGVANHWRTKFPRFDLLSQSFFSTEG